MSKVQHLHFGLGTKWFKLARTMVVNELFTENSQNVWSYNKLLIDLACSVCRSEISYPSFSARTSARSVRTKNVGPVFH